MVHHFNHRANSVEVNEDNLHHAAQSDATTIEQLKNPDYFPEPQYWVSTEQVPPNNLAWCIGFRSIARATDERTIVNAIVPYGPAGNSLPLMPWEGERKGAAGYAMLSANLSSMVLDYTARQKVQGTNVNWYIVEQLPVLAEADYQRKFGKETAADIVKRHVLELTYTAHDLEPFARDLGYTGQPFAWDEERRRHLRARLDALYFHLYGLTLDDTAYVMDTFPIVRKYDEEAFNGRYLTKELVLGYYKALAAGDTETRVQIR
jgi:hypothetical protein